MMSNVLLLLSPENDAPNAIAYAIRRAGEVGGGLIAVAVLDAKLTERVATTLANVGFVGEKVSESVMETLEREHRAQAEDLLNQVGEQARKHGITFRPMIEEGDPGEICAALVREHEIATAVLVAEKRSWLTRFLSRSAPLNLPTLAGCEVKVMED
jgi:nucleotide-binding universal stress UspA family protein